MTLRESESSSEPVVVPVPDPSVPERLVPIPPPETPTLTKAQRKELLAWVDSVWDAHLQKFGLAHTRKGDHRATVEQLAQIIEARAQEIALAASGAPPPQEKKC